MWILSSVLMPLRVRRTRGCSVFVRRIHQHDAAAVGLDPLEDQLHDPLQELIDVERVADGQRRAVHDLQIAPRPGEPGVLRRVGAEVEDLAAFLLRERFDDPRRIGRVLRRELMLMFCARSAPDSSSVPVKSISVLPACTWSPLSSVCCSIRLPLTNVPLELFRSEMTNSLSR